MYDIRSGYLQDVAIHSALYTHKDDEVVPLPRKVGREGRGKARQRLRGVARKEKSKAKQESAGRRRRDRQDKVKCSLRALKPKRNVIKRFRPQELARESVTLSGLKEIYTAQNLKGVKITARPLKTLEGMGWGGGEERVRFFLLLQTEQIM